MPLKLCVLTGVPGSGKSTAANLISRDFPGNWAIVHADDFIGPTFELFRPKEWSQIRKYHTIYTGWSAGWHLSQGRNVLVEGHLKDREEIRNLLRSVKDRTDEPVETRITWLDGDVEEIVRRLTENPFREPQWNRPDRAEKFRFWITEWKIDPSIADSVVDGRGKSSEVVSREIAAAFDIPIKY
jgi:adenylate kinase family enzyme